MKCIAYMNGVTWKIEFLCLKELLHPYSQSTCILMAFKQLYSWSFFLNVSPLPSSLLLDSMLVHIYATVLMQNTLPLGCLQLDNIFALKQCIIKLQVAQ